MDDPVFVIGVFHGNHFEEAAVKALFDRAHSYSWKDIPANIRRLHVRYHPVSLPGFFPMERMKGNYSISNNEGEPFPFRWIKRIHSGCIVPP